LGMESVRAMKEAGCVYLAFPGGGSPLLSASIRECVSVGWKDLIAHYRLVRLRVEALGPAVVAIDAHGNSMYEKVRARMEQGFTRILEDLRASAPNPSLLSDK
ncbi:MAG: fumarate hydratase C-terminal domain-containing protein, partial [Deltaproteobacteria bacterium]|nr:fumarate hydratase C-terminal domain-containing protein [Deltaproteobacteria bacterium]